MIRFLPLLLLGCAKDEQTESLIEGSISVADIGESADIAWNQAFYATKNGAMLAFITGVPGANCPQIAEFLSSSDGATEKEGIYDGGGCVMTIKIDEWSSEYEASWPGEGWDPSAGTSIRCEFGAGEWERETNSTGREDYYWTGTTWDGQPTVFDWRFSEDEDAVELEMDMSAFEGDLIYESSGQLAGTGEVSGTLRAEACPALENAQVL